jgi:glycosyltransferase involved in cell wall biosynthesis
VQLTIVGCRPPGMSSSADRQIIPFLSKDTPAGRRDFEALWKSHDVLFLPTRGDTFGIVFCEAAAYGMPVITSDVGGTASVVDDGTTGFVLPQSASPEAFADVITRIASEGGLYERLSRDARQKYESRLNWSAWARDLVGVIERAVSEPAGRPGRTATGAATGAR